MEIEINYKTIYGRLNQQPESSPHDQFFIEAVKQMREGEQWKNERLKENINLIKLTKVFPWTNTPLPQPLINTDGYFERLGELYSGSVTLIYKSDLIEKITSKLSEKMQKQLSSNWSPLDNKGSGYILDRANIAAVINASYPYYKISIGEYGAVERRFGTLEEFAGDIGILQNVTNCFLNQIYKLSAKHNKTPMSPEGLIIKVANIF